MGDKMAIRGITTFLISAAVGFFLITFQNCSPKMNFEAQAPAATPDDSNPLDREPSFKEVSSSFRATQNKIFPTIKVVLVVDNSPSMRLIQQKLSEGLPSLVDDIYMYDTEFYLYTTSQAPGDSKRAVEFVKECEILQKDSADPTKLVLLETRAGTCPTTPTPDGNPDDRKIFRDVDRAKLAQSLLPLEDFRLKGGQLSRVEFEAFKLRLSTAIQSAGTQGSADELGICSMVRTIYESSGGPFKVVEPPSGSTQKDVVVFLAISDENDQSMLPNGQPHSQCFHKKEKVKDCTSSREINVGSVPSQDPKDAYFTPSYAVALTGDPRPNTHYFRFDIETEPHNVARVNFRRDRMTNATETYQVRAGTVAKEWLVLTTEKKPEEQFKLAYEERVFTNGTAGEIFTWETQEGNPKRYLSTCATTTEMDCNAEQLLFAQGQVVGSNINRRLKEPTYCKVTCVAPVPSTARTGTQTNRADYQAPSAPTPLTLSSCSSLEPSVPSTDRSVACRREYQQGVAPALLSPNLTRNNSPLCGSAGSAQPGQAVSSSQRAWIVNVLNSRGQYFESATVEACSNNPRVTPVNDSITHNPSQCSLNTCSNSVVTDAIAARILGLGGTPPWQLIGGSCAPGTCAPDSTPVLTGQRQPISGTCPSVGQVPCTETDYNQLEISRASAPFKRIKANSCVRVCEAQTPQAVSVDTSHQLRFYSADPSMIPTAAMVPSSCTSLGSVTGVRIVGVKNGVETEYATVAQFYSQTNGNRGLTNCAFNQLGTLMRKSIDGGTRKQYYCSDSAQTTDIFGHRLEAGSPVPDFQDIFRTQATRLFNDRFLVSSFITKAEDITPMEGTSRCADSLSLLALVSEGARYRALSESTPGGRANSVCDQNYSSGFVGVAQWIQSTIDTTYLPPDLPTSGRVEMTGVWIKRPNGNRIDLRLGVDVSISGNELRIMEGLVEPDDVIHWRANVWEDE